jgi:hypothetical protein
MRRKRWERHQRAREKSQSTRSDRSGSGCEPPGHPNGIPYTDSKSRLGWMTLGLNDDGVWEFCRSESNNWYGSGSYEWPT